MRKMKKYYDPSDFFHQNTGNKTNAYERKWNQDRNSIGNIRPIIINQNQKSKGQNEDLYNG